MGLRGSARLLCSAEDSKTGLGPMSAQPCFFLQKVLFEVILVACLEIPRNAILTSFLSFLKTGSCSTHICMPPRPQMSDGNETLRAPHKDFQSCIQPRQRVTHVHKHFVYVTLHTCRSICTCTVYMPVYRCYVSCLPCRRMIKCMCMH